MFGKLKTRSNRRSRFENRPNPTSYSKSAGATSTTVKGNEKDRLVRCRHCGFICDRDRDVNLRDGSYAGFAINQGAKLTAGTSIGDKVVPAAGAVVSSADTYYSRTVAGGCPACGSYLYHPGQSIIQFPMD